VKEKKKNHSDYWKLYQEAESIDKRLFAEQKSNVLLHAGDHYSRQGSKFWNHVRDAKQIDNSVKIRITKNHIQRICKKYINNIVNLAPGVTVSPKNKSEIQDQKCAELNQSVWMDIKERHCFPEKVQNYVSDFVIQGEVAVKCFWNPHKGKVVGYETAADENGDPAMEEDGSPKAGTAIFSGDLEFERIFTFNLMRDPGSRNMNDAKWLGLRKMVEISVLKKMVGGDKTKEKFITETQDDTYILFDPIMGRHVESKNQCLTFEMYYRPSIEYPNGYFVFMTPSGILFEGELPFGIFPIIYEGFDEVPSTPRHHSIIKVLRPFQAEINRAASKMVEHQITLGDDKIIYQAGGKITQGGILPGVRGVQVSGDAPTVLAGRTGDQYLPYVQAQVSEMYVAANMPEDDEEKAMQMDPNALLYRSMRDKKRYSMYAEKIERFLKKICLVSLEIAKNYYQDDMLIPVIGRSEQVNIAEFRTSQTLNFTIIVEPQSDDVESKLGKMLQITSILQYVGSSLKPEDIGKLIRTMPYVNEEELFSDLTMDVDNATNDILALDRGQYPAARPYDDHKYHIKRLTSRKSKPDYQFLDAQIGQLYDKKIDEHEKIMADQAAQVQRGESGFIPSGGPLTPVDLYVQDPTSPKNTQRARVPYEAIVWLLNKLEDQGMSQAAIENLSQGAQADIAQRLPTPSNQGGQEPPTTFNGGSGVPN
jgi:hypothetical protein